MTLSGHIATLRFSFAFLRSMSDMGIYRKIHCFGVLAGIEVDTWPRS